MFEPLELSTVIVGDEGTNPARFLKYADDQGQV